MDSFDTGNFKADGRGVKCECDLSWAAVKYWSEIKKRDGKNILFPWKSGLRLRKENCFYEPRQAGRMRVLCGEGAGGAHTPVLWELGWEMSPDMWQGEAAEAARVPPLSPPAAAACCAALSCAVPRACLAGIHPQGQNNIVPQPCLLPPPTACSHSLPRRGQGKVEILPGCFPSQALPFCLLNMYLSSPLPGVASLLSLYSCVILGVGHMNKCTLVGNESDLYNSWLVCSCCDVW